MVPTGTMSSASTWAAAHEAVLSPRRFARWESGKPPFFIRIYLRMVASSNPTVLTQYPRDQKCFPLLCLLPSKYLWIRIALFPFKNPMTKAMLNFGATLRHIWMWSAFSVPSTISIPFCLHKSFKISATWRLNLPYSFLFRYLGTITKWYLQSQRTCDKLCQSCIGSSSLRPQSGLSWRESLFFFSPER